MYSVDNNRLVELLNKAKEIGVAIEPDKIAMVGYQRLLKRSNKLENAFRVIEVARSFGADIYVGVSIVADKYKQLTAPQQQPAT